MVRHSPLVESGSRAALARSTITFFVRPCGVAPSSSSSIEVGGLRVRRMYMRMASATSSPRAMASSSSSRRACCRMLGAAAIIVIMSTVITASRATRA